MESASEDENDQKDKNTDDVEIVEVKPKEPISKFRIYVTLLIFRIQTPHSSNSREQRQRRRRRGHPENGERHAAEGEEK